MPDSDLSPKRGGGKKDDMPAVAEFPFVSELAPAPLRPEPEEGSPEWVLDLAHRAEELGGVVTSTQAAALLRISVQTVHELATRGQLRRIRSWGNDWLYSRADIMRRLAGNKGKPGRPRKQPE
jgi:excisionase family DNA binding protein